MPPSELWSYAWCLALSVVSAWVFTRGLRWIAPRVGMVDQPTARKNHSVPTPLLGGVAVYLAAMGSYATLARLDQRTLWLMGGALVVLVLGLWDDRVGLRARFRLAIQLLGATGIVVAGVRLDWLGWAPADYAITILWLLGVTNAMNCVDCADGIAAGVAAIAGAAFCLVAISYGHFAVAMMAIAISGSCLGFLAFNFPRASIFLGDAGSTLLGLLLGAIGIGASRGAPPLQQAWIAALPLAVPVWDIILVHMRRWRAGTRNLRTLLESSGLDHLPHRLQKAGLSPRKVALSVYLMAVVLAALGGMIVRYQRGGLVAGMAIVCAGLISGERPFGAFIARLSRARHTPTQEAWGPKSTPAEAGAIGQKRPTGRPGLEVGK